MNEYKVGDKFLVEIEEVYENGLPFNDTPCKLYRIKGFNSLVFDENGLDKLQKHVVTKRENIEEIRRTAYEKGLEEAWEIAVEILCNMRHITYGELRKIFGLSRISSNADVIKKLTPQDAKEKLAAYKDDVKVGDVVKVKNGYVFVVTHISNDSHFFGITTTGDTYTAIHKSECEKTGKHIDIQCILSQIGEQHG